MWLRDVSLINYYFDDKTVWLNIDECPFWLDSLAGTKVLAQTGQNDVGVRRVNADEKTRYCGCTRRILQSAYLSVSFGQTPFLATPVQLFSDLVYMTFSLCIQSSVV